MRYAWLILGVVLLAGCGTGDEPASGPNVESPASRVCHGLRVVEILLPLAQRLFGCTLGVS